MEAGAHGCLLKTAQPSEVIETVRSIHSGEIVLHIAIAAKVAQLYPFLRDAGLINPSSCSSSSGDSGVATTLPHGLARPKVNRPTTPCL